MKVGIMQPYFFPYIGYWQLLSAVDTYVIYDDVNFIKGGWINRNNILVNGEAKLINLQMYKASPNKLINENELMVNQKFNTKLLKTIEMAYSKAPHFEQVYPIIEDIVLQNEPNLAKYLIYSIKHLCRYMGINTQLLISSSLEKDNTLRGQQKVLEICKIVDAKIYINAIGGQDLYSSDDFLDKSIKLEFLKTNEITYRQFSNEFLPNLSIIDVLMFNSVDETKELLEKYTLV